MIVIIYSQGKGCSHLMVETINMPATLNKMLDNNPHVLPKGSALECLGVNILYRVR